MKQIVISCYLLCCTYRVFAFDTLSLDDSDGLYLGEVEMPFCMQSEDSDDQPYDSFHPSNQFRQILPPPIDVQAYLGVTEGRGIGYKTGYTTLGVLLDFKNLQNQSIQTFIDARCHYLNNKRWATNLGVVARYWSPSLKKVFGGNVYYDFRQRRHTGYHQIGVGLEMFACQYDIRVNGYLPIGHNRAFSKRREFTYPGGFFAIRRGYREALYGADAEIETSLMRWTNCLQWTNCLCIDPYFAIGPYYYQQNSRGNLVGGKCRLGFNYLECINIEVRASYDPVFHTCVQGVLSVDIPWCRRRTSCCQNECSNIIPVQRQEIIVEGRRLCKWKTNF